LGILDARGHQAQAPRRRATAVSHFLQFCFRLWKQQDGVRSAERIECRHLHFAQATVEDQAGADCRG
jgi:hypothetical protein